MEDSSTKTTTKRPTPVDKSTYKKFGNKCRTNDRQISDVLTDLMKQYLKKGEKMFNN